MKNASAVKKIEAMTPAAVRDIALKIEALAGPELEALGVTIRYRGGSYSAREATVKFDVRLGGEADREVEDRRNFELGAPLIGADPAWFGRTFDHKGKQHRVSGLRLNAPAYPISAERLDNGKTYSFTGAYIRRLMEGGAS